MSGALKVARKLARQTVGYARKAVGPAALDRESLAGQYLRGDGIEIGALHNPLMLPRGARARYVDRMSSDDLREQYPELRSAVLVEVDIIADGERLAGVAGASQEFVIANHFLEHCQNPIGAIRNMLRVLRPGGILYLAVPDKRYTFDVDRPVTTGEHLLTDDAEGPEGSKQQHFEEWVRLVERVQETAEAEKRVAELLAMDYSIHFHVWSQTEILELLLMLKQRLGFVFEIELLYRDRLEVTTVLRKTEG